MAHAAVINLNNEFQANTNAECKSTMQFYVDCDWQSKMLLILLLILLRKERYLYIHYIIIYIYIYIYKNIYNNQKIYYTRIIM